MARTVLITGATRGVGRGIADAFARRGDRLVLVARSTDDNPNKVGQLENLGIRMTARLPHVMPATVYNRAYLETKATRSGHQMQFDSKPHLSEQDDPVNVED